MSAGTITLTNNSAAVSGAGTAFTTDLKAGDFIVAVVGGVTYTLPVKTVNSATGVTLLKNYDGPTQAGAAWSAVPRDTMNAITAQLAAETAQALRGLNYDKQNWQQVFSATGNVTVKLPDGSSFTGPAWGGIVTSLDGKVDKTELGEGAYRAVQKNSVDGTDKSLIAVGGFGLGGGGVDTPWSTAVMGSFRSSNIDGPTVSTVYMGINMPHGSDSKYCAQLMARGNLGLWYRCRENGVMLPYLRVYDTGNTSVDSNGFIKKASPIIKIFHDGSFETNDESAGASVEREGVGVYRILGVLGMNSDGAWGGIDGGFEIPTDRNGQRLLWLDYEVEADGSILVKTYHRTYPDAPAFARNIKEGYEEGDLIDIPSDQFVSVRVEMPQDSIWNMAQKAAREEMEQEQIIEE
ncbi:phage tail protein [Hafnia paralvei]|uniref:phage tail fiber protein n=1 Tax=Hafnia paralvei TaxID=546367 RepID=UPI003EE6639C